MPMRVHSESLNPVRLAAVSFYLCGFQAVHIVHEPFYYLMPYMPLCLLLAHRYMTSGKFIWIPRLAGLGHAAHARAFSDPDVDSGIGDLVRCWQVWANGENRGRMVWRVAGLFLGLFWGALIAWVQLAVDVGADWSFRFCTASTPLGPLFISAGPLGSVCSAGGLPGPAPRHRRQLLGPAGNIAGEACAYAGVIVWILGFVAQLQRSVDEVSGRGGFLFRCHSRWRRCQGGGPMASFYS